MLFMENMENIVVPGMENMENIVVPGRRYILYYLCKNMRGLARLWPCKTFKGSEPCCLYANKWSDPCLEHPIQIQCEACLSQTRATVCLRRCPDLRPPPYLAPVGPVQFHVPFNCATEGCNTQGTIAILRAASHAEFMEKPENDEDDSAMVYALECQVVGPIHVVQEWFGVLGLSLPTSHYLGQGLAGQDVRRAKTKYQGQIPNGADRGEAVNGRSVRFARLKTDGQPHRIERLDGMWKEAKWLVDGYFEKDCGLVETDFTVSVPGWPPTNEQSQEYRQNTPFEEYGRREIINQNMWVD